MTFLLAQWPTSYVAAIILGFLSTAGLATSVSVSSALARQPTSAIVMGTGPAPICTHRSICAQRDLLSKAQPLHHHPEL